jgi:starvation-inducible DNA-binding protein
MARAATPRSTSTSRTRAKPAARAGTRTEKAGTLRFTAPGLSEEKTAPLVELLSDRLVALVDLGLTLKHIHWNLVGPNFIGVHEMLDPQYEGVSAMVDTVAERIATLGGSPNGLPGNLVARREWDDYDIGRDTVTAHLAALDLVYAGVISSHRDAIEESEKIDPVTEDMLIAQTAVLEQYHWFVRAHLEGTDGELATEGAKSERAAARRAR